MEMDQKSCVRFIMKWMASLHPSNPLDEWIVWSTMVLYCSCSSISTTSWPDFQAFGTNQTLFNGYCLSVMNIIWMAMEENEGHQSSYKIEIMQRWKRFNQWQTTNRINRILSHIHIHTHTYIYSSIQTREKGCELDANAIDFVRKIF